MADGAPSPEIRAEAAAWLARLHAEDRDATDEAAFRAWLCASPVHAAAFEAVDRMWSDVGGVKDFRAGFRPTRPTRLLSAPGWPPALNMPTPLRRWTGCGAMWAV